MPKILKFAPKATREAEKVIDKALKRRLMERGVPHDVLDQASPELRSQALDYVLGKKDTEYGVAKRWTELFKLGRGSKTKERHIDNLIDKAAAQPGYENALNNAMFNEDFSRVYVTGEFPQESVQRPRRIKFLEAEADSSVQERADTLADDFIDDVLEYGPKTKWHRLRSLGPAAVGTGVATGLSLNDDEAEAFPLGKFSKNLSKTAREGMQSSAAKRLIGHTLQGKKITDVKSGTGDWRSILFEDGSEMTVKKSELHALTRAKGTKDYMDQFGDEDAEGKLTQALKSLKYHEVRADNRPLDTVLLKRRYAKGYVDAVQKGDPGQAPELTHVHYNNKYFTMPKAYADLLEEYGMLKIDRKNPIKPKVK